MLSMSAGCGRQNWSGRERSGRNKFEIVFQLQEGSFQKLPGECGQNIACSCGQQKRGKRIAVKMKRLSGIHGKTVQEIEAIADGAGVNEKAVAKQKLEPFLRREHGKVSERGGSESGAGENEWGELVALGEEGERQGDEESDPSAAAIKNRDKKGRSGEDGEKSTCHESIEAAEKVGVESDTVEREVVADERRKANDGNSETAKLSERTEPNEQRPENIELLFDGQGPTYAERTDGKRRMFHEKILKEERVGPPGRRLQENCRGFRGSDQGNDDEHGNEHRVIKRPDTQNATGVEILEIGGSATGVQKNAGDKEAGENEEKVDTHPTIAKDKIEFEGRIFTTSIVKKNQQDGNATDSVELGNFLSH